MMKKFKKEIIAIVSGIAFAYAFFTYVLYFRSKWRLYHKRDVYSCKHNSACYHTDDGMGIDGIT